AGSFDVASGQPQLAVAVEEMLAVAPGHPSVGGQRTAEPRLGRLEVHFRFLGPAERHEVIAEVESSVRLNIGVREPGYALHEVHTGLVPFQAALEVPELAVDP